MKGNKASTWEDLIDHRKLPYMATIRNIRNMIRAGISEKHHKLVLRKIADEGAVRSSKQSSFRFFSAYDVLKDLDDEYDRRKEEEEDEEKKKGSNSVATTMGSGHGGGKGSGRGGSRGNRGGGGKGGGDKGGRGGGGRGGRGGRNERGGISNRGKETKSVTPLLYTKEIVARYRKSLDEAVRIATTFNTKLIQGRTVVFLDLGGGNVGMLPRSAKGLGKSVRSPDELAYLLALQASVACEDCRIIGYGSAGKTINLSFDQKDTILGAVAGLGEIKAQLNSSEMSSELPELGHFIHDREHVDNMLVFSMDPLKEGKVRDFVHHYQIFINCT